MLAAAFHSWLKHLFRVSGRRRTFALRRTRSLCPEPLEDRTLLSTFFVVNTGDSGAGKDNSGDLRYCITQANATPGRNVIDFALPGTGTQTIHLNSALPALTNSVILDGWSQGGSDYTGAPLIQLDGSAVPNGSGLTIVASNCIVRGLAINDFGNYGLFVGAGSANDWVYGCYFGVTPDGLHAAPNTIGGVYLGGMNTLLGTDTQLGTDALPETNANGIPADAQRNLISGNNGFGVIVVGSDNLVAGDLIGLGADGSTALGNSGAGVLVFGANNTIGGAATGAGNVISANFGSGILMDGTSATGNLVQGDNIGTDPSGMSALGNTGDGVVVTDGAFDNFIGGSAAGERNIISGNSGAGVALGRVTAAGEDNRVLGNYIGINADGTAVLGNGFEGVLINDGSSGEVIGGSNPGDGNVISGNGLFGVNIINASKNTVQGNLIGVLPDGVSAAPNALGGVVVQTTFLATTGNLIGGTTDGAGNLISGNAGPGVLLSGKGVTGNVVAGNRIGTTAAGDSPLGNAGDGVRLDTGASNNTIGGTTSGAGNVIAFNAKGVVVAGDDSTADSILGNSIFGNAGLGIDLGDDGPTPNGTPPPGPNNFQPQPVLLSDGDGQIAGSLSAAADTTYRIELFASPASGPAGQGQTFLGAVRVTTGEDGLASFTFAVSLPAGEVVTATATDLATGDTSEFSAGVVANAPPVVTIASNSSSVVVNAGQPLSLIGFFTDPDNDELVGTDNSDQFVGTVDYGDGSGVQPLVLANNAFLLNHVYQQEGNYTITVAITDDGATGFASVPVEVYDPGVDITQIGQGTAPPGGSAVIQAPGVSATLFRDASDAASGSASLLVGDVPASEVEQLGGGSAPGGPGMLTSAYDIRSVDLTARDRVVVTFQYPAGGGTPSLVYFDTASHSFQPVLSSTLQPDSVVIDSVNHTITLTFDASSTPQLGDLTGTVFVVEVPQTQPSPPAAPPPLSPLPPPPALSAGASATTSSASAATSGTATITPAPFLATSLPSGTVSETTPASSSAQTSSNNSSVNSISAFSPFVLIITAVHPGLSSAEAGAAAELEPNASTATAPNILPLLNRLPRVPGAEESVAPPDSGPSAVLSPSRAGLPKGADNPAMPAPPPAPPARPAAEHAPPVGFQFHPDTPAALRLATASTSETEEGTDWLDDVLSTIFDRLTGHVTGREVQHASLHPALAVLASCAGFIPRAARSRKDDGGKEEEEFGDDRRQGSL